MRRPEADIRRLIGKRSKRDKQKGFVMLRGAPTEVRFWAHVDKTDSCWLWNGTPDKNGYARFKVRGVKILVHRYSYELHFGPIPTGLTIDHVKDRGCINRHCVNPAHLEAITGAENTRRASQKEFCIRHHPLNEKTTYVYPDGHRECKACRKEVYYARAREARARTRHLTSYSEAV